MMIMPWTRARLRCAGVALAAALLAGCTDDGNEPPPDTKPASVGAITKIAYDGVSDDLLTAGLGKTGLGGTTPIPANPASPTAAELRRLAIFADYTALVDVNPRGGYGTLSGPKHRRHRRERPRRSRRRSRRRSSRRCGHWCSRP